MTAALYDEIQFEDGAVRQSNFHDYRMVNMFDAPAIDVHIIDSDESPGGIGEAGVPPRRAGPGPRRARARGIVRAVLTRGRGHEPGSMGGIA